MDNKLGLKIVRVNQGSSKLFDRNDDQIWSKNIRDVRKELEIIDNLDGSSAVLMLTCIENGYMLTVSKFIEGRTSDCLSAWIYVPSTINITGKQLVEKVEAVKQEILANERDDERLSQLFSMTYESIQTNIDVKGNGDKYAYRYYGPGAKFTLSELLDAMHQSYYKNYKSIFLLDKSTKLRCLSGDDLTDKKVSSLVLIEYPGILDSFVPYIDEKPFVKSMYAVEGDRIKIEWRRHGYKSIQTESIVAKDMKYSIPTPNQYQRVIPYSTIKVVDEYGTSINDYELFVNQKYINKGEQIIVNEAVVDNVSLTISANGYESQICNNVNLNQDIKVILKKEKFKYKFMLPLMNEEGYYPIEISRNSELKDSPVEGYYAENGYIKRNGKNYLIYKPLKAFKRSYLIFGLVCLLIIFKLGICGGYVVSNYIGGGDSGQVTELQNQIKVLESRNQELEKKIKENQVTNAETPKATKTLEEAITYLETHEIWKLKEMEEYTDLEDLWCFINYRDFNKIKKFEKKLKSSNRFMRLLTEINKCYGKELSYGRTSYCPDNDYEITVSGYIDDLEDRREKCEKKRGGNQKTSGTGNNTVSRTNQDDWN